MTLLSGTETHVPLSEIDIEKTERENVRNLSDVVVIDTNGTRAFSLGTSATPDRPTLQDRIRAEKGRTRDLTSEATSADSQSTRQIPRTPAGFPDLQQAMREPLSDTQLETDLSASLRAMGVAKFRLYQGTEPDRLMIEVTADGRFEVFQQLEALATAFSLATDAGPYDAMEVLLLNGRRSRAGQFLLSQDNVPLLAKGILSPSEFFLQYVQF